MIYIPQLCPLPHSWLLLSPKDICHCQFVYQQFQIRGLGAPLEGQLLDVED